MTWQTALSIVTNIVSAGVVLYLSGLIDWQRKDRRRLHERYMVAVRELTQARLECEGLYDRLQKYEGRMTADEYVEAVLGPYRIKDKEGH